MELLDRLRNATLFSYDPRRIYHLAAVFCLVFVALKIMKLISSRAKSIRDLQPFPGPPTHWLFGHTHEFLQDGRDLEKVMEWVEKYPFASPLWFGPFFAILNIYHPEYMKTVLASTEPKDDITYKFFVPWIGKLVTVWSFVGTVYSTNLYIILYIRSYSCIDLCFVFAGDGLLVSQGQKWFQHRRLLTPGFHYDILKYYVPLMADSTVVMLDKWETYANQEESFELFEHLSLMTLDSIMKCAFSCKSNCQTEGGTNAYIKAVYELSYLINLRTRIFPYHNDIIFHLSPHGYRFRKACKIAHQHTDDIIKQRKKALQEQKDLGTTQERYLDFLDILFGTKDEGQQGLSDEDIRAEVDTFMFEGHDTTATAIAWTFYSLACHPKHQQICREEVTQVLKGKDTIEWEDLSKIPYTTMCIKESLRLYSPVPGAARKLTKTMTFFDGRTLPEGFRIGISIYGLHRNPAVWENPNEFDPLRFLPENCANRSPHAFVPFSAGPRNCIGQNFAMNEIKVAVVLTLKRYRLEPDPNKIPKKLSRVVLRSLNGIHLKIKRVQPEA
ncbi:cytochrome P450 4B1-like [Arapaima gigas]